MILRKVSIGFRSLDRASTWMMKELRYQGSTLYAHMVSVDSVYGSSAGVYHHAVCFGQS